MWIVDHEGFSVFEHNWTVPLCFQRFSCLLGRTAELFWGNKIICAAELFALREANCAATTGSAQAGSVRGFQARSEPSDCSIQNRLHRPPQGIPSGWTRRCRRSGFWFLMSVFLSLYLCAWIHVGCGPDLMSHTCCTYSCTHMSVTHQTYKLWCDTAYEHTFVSFVFRVVASVVRLPDMRPKCEL